MRLWQLPPKYLDNDALINEQLNITFMLHSKVNLPKEWSGYLVLQCKLCESELKLRKLEFIPVEVNNFDFTLQNTPSKDEIWNSIQKLLESWESKLLQPDMMERYDVVNSKSAEDVWLENEWLIENARREYGL